MDGEEALTPGGCAAIDGDVRQYLCDLIDAGTAVQGALGVDP